MGYRDDTTKPSRINRRRKRRWRNSLTDCAGLGMLSNADNSQPGVGNPFLQRRESAVIGVFLCASFSTALCSVYAMAGLFWQSLRLAAPLRGISYPTQARLPTVGKLADGYSISKGVTA